MTLFRKAHKDIVICHQDCVKQNVEAPSAGRITTETGPQLTADTHVKER